MSFEFLQNILFNNYVILLGVILMVYLVFVFEKKSIVILAEIIFDCVVLAFVLIRNIFLNYNMFLMIFCSSLIICIFNSIANLKSLKKIGISILAQITENTILLLATFFVLKLKRIGNDFEALNDSNLKIIFASILSIGLMFCNKINVNIILNTCSIKEKTEMMNTKILYSKGMEICKEKIKNNINNYIMIYVLLDFVSIMFMNNINFEEELINEIGTEILISSIVSIITIMLSMIICTMLNAIFNSKKEIYKTISQNKLEDKRTLKI